MNDICDKMGEASEEEMKAYDGGAGHDPGSSDMAHDFYMIDSKVEEVARALGLDGDRSGPGRDGAFRRSEDEGAS